MAWYTSELHQSGARVTYILLIDDSPALQYIVIWNGKYFPADLVTEVETVETKMTFAWTETKYARLVVRRPRRCVSRALDKIRSGRA